MGNDRDYVGTGSFADSEDTVEYCVSPTHGVDALRQPPSSSHEYCTGPTAQPPSTTSSFDRSSFPYQWNSYPLPRGDLPQSFYSDEQELFPSSQPSSHDSTLYYPPAPIPQPSYNNTTLTADTDYSTAQNLSDALGELKIGEFGIGKLQDEMSATFLTCEQRHTSDNRKTMMSNQTGQFLTLKLSFRHSIAPPDHTSASLRR